MDMQLVNVPRGEYEALKDDSLFLQCLEALGVDNWDPGYSEAYRMADNIRNGRPEFEGIH